MKTFKEMYGMTRNWNLQGGEKGGGEGGLGSCKKKIPIVGEVHAWCSAYMYTKYDLYNSHLEV